MTATLEYCSPGYGEILTLVDGVYRSSDCRETFTLQTKIPTDRFNKEIGVWIIHSCVYTLTETVNSPMGGCYSRIAAIQGIAIDNYGNTYSYNRFNGICHDTIPPKVGTANYMFPLSKELIDMIKRIPTELGDDAMIRSSNSFICNSIPANICPLAKLAAETNYKSSKSTLHLQRELEAAHAKTFALEAELRALKRPPTLNVVEIHLQPMPNVVEMVE